MVSTPPGSEADPAVLSTKHQTLRGYATTTMVCIAIALLLWALEISSLKSSLIVSFCIGGSIQTLFTLLRPTLEERIGHPVVSAVLILSGLAVGLVLAGFINFDDPLFLLLEAPGTVVFGVLTGVVGYLIVNTRERLLKADLQMAQLERSRAEQAKQLTETELKMLQAQIEPHFLFNTLSNVQSLVHDEPDKADAMLSKLSLLLRSSFSPSHSETMTLAQELELVKAYLGIQQIRMGERLTFSIDCDAHCAGEPIPPLLIQPLVENAITHGIEPQAGPGDIRIRATATASELRITVTDNGIGPEAALKRQHQGTGSRGAGSALANIRARLRSAFADTAELRLLAIAPKGACAELTLPRTAPAANPEAERKAGPGQHGRDS